MMRSSEIVKDAGTAMINTAFCNTTGYWGASIFGARAAVSVGSFGTMIGASLLGGAALYVPALMLKTSLNYLNMMSDLMALVFDFSFFVSSAALGAFFLGLAIKPFVICAAVGMIVNVCMAPFLPAANNAEQVNAATPAF